MFTDPMSLQRFKRVVEKRFLAYTRFRHKAVDTAAGATWQEDAHFDLDWHVQLAALPGQGDGRRTPRDGAQKRALERFASQLASSPLDKHRPLWQFHLVERYQGCSALVARLHHSYTDGIRSEEHTSELQSLMRISYAAFCLKKQNKQTQK